MVCAALAAAVQARPELAVWMVLVPAGVLLATVDLTAARLPDIVTLPLAVTTLSLLGVAALLPGTGGSWRRALLGSLAFGVFCLALFLINPAKFGFGDVKVAPTIGASTLSAAAQGRASVMCASEGVAEP
ncbi:prepilin peptidase [Streptomyces sp. ATE26]|uniref:prepilin peptidase n=1 Tax=Streptomyces sp. ATE26 TaxID=2954237 RepID=UPI0024831669|nr:prepilin peptidase [Streptomyces sp. ATE26]MDI1455684.1 prepilin peptidase [Streptomyces sp. ATE26]